jgi:uncharacterized protein YggU (UPF0235/DUF167 family)
MPLDREFKITDASGGAAFSVRVVTRTARSEIAGIQDDGIIKVRLEAAPEEANQALVALLSSALEVEAAKIEIVGGHNSRDKLISIDGVTTAYVEGRIQSLASKAGAEDPS